MMRFEGRTALITGGTSGIGLATARRLLAEGARVAINGRDAERMETALALLAGLGDVIGICADISDERQVAELLRETLAVFGPVDVLVNGAGVDGAGASVLDLKLDGWRRVLDVNLTGPFLVTQAVARAMPSAGGAVVNVSSLNGLAAEPHFADYNSAKGGLVMLTRSLAVDLVDLNIRVNAVCPGYILTPMTAPYTGNPDAASAIRAAIPMRRFGMPEEVAAAIAFLASSDASYITGEVLVVDGGRFARQ
jgi:NAD(P)-dependent dehydrogenase (short-subunit alcohol dehydrogenase family)